MNTKFNIAAVVLAAGLLAATQLQAHDSTAPDGATAQPGQMMGGHMMGMGMQPGKMGPTDQMDQMVETCNVMMKTAMLDHHQSMHPESGDETED